MTAEEKLAARIGVPIRFADVDDGELRVHCAIAGSGPKLLLVHGLNVGWGEWYAVIAELAKTKTVIAMDLPGAGGSTRVDFDSERFPELLLKSVDMALGAFMPEGGVVVGHSLGAWAALTLLAHKHPLIRAVAAIDPVGFTAYLPPRFRLLAFGPAARFLSRTVMAPTRKNLDAFLVDVFVRRENVWPEYFSYVFEHITKSPVEHPFRLIHRLSEPFRVRKEFLFGTEDLSRMGSCPVLFIHGSDDPLIPLASVREAWKSVPGARTIVLEGTGHVPPIESPSEVISLLKGLSVSV